MWTLGKDRLRTRVALSYSLLYEKNFTVKTVPGNPVSTTLGRKIALNKQRQNLIYPPVQEDHWKSSWPIRQKWKGRTCCPRD